MRNLLVLFFLLRSAALFAEEIHPLVRAYPDFLREVKDNTVYWHDGTTMPFDDGREKSFDELLNQPDIEDQLRMAYPVGTDSFAPPPLDYDPGRIRYEPLFAKMYGATPQAVEQNLVEVTWLPKSKGQSVRFNRVNGAAARLQAVSEELDALPHALQKYVGKISGTYNWRAISGTKRLSTHAFGSSIDINIDYANYWRWDQSGKLEYKNRVPREIVEIFEKHGFIWGGKWYHYDTMHFEYRPELLPAPAADVRQD